VKVAFLPCKSGYWLCVLAPLFRYFIFPARNTKLDTGETDAIRKAIMDLTPHGIT
jgi:hypothetical protein